MSSTVFYHYSNHKFAVGDVIEPRISFPFPEAYAWAGKSLAEVTVDSTFLYEVESLGEVEQSPFHDWAVRNQTGFTVLAILAAP